MELSWAVAPLAIETNPPEGSSVTLAVAGEIDRDNCGGLRLAVGEVLSGSRPERICLDLSAVTFLDSAGIRALLLCRRDARVHGCEFGLADVHPHVRQVLGVTGLLGEFGVG